MSHVTKTTKLIVACLSYLTDMMSHIQLTAKNNAKADGINRDAIDQQTTVLVRQLEELTVTVK